jgi:hypothetical protein
MGRENKNIIILLMTFPLIFVSTSESIIPAGFFVVFIDEYLFMKSFAVAGIVALFAATIIPTLSISRGLIIFALASLMICWGYCFAFSENKLVTLLTSFPFFFFIYRLVVKRLMNKVYQRLTSILLNT